MRNSVIFIGEENRTNSELYQLLNWRYKVSYYNQPEDIAFDEIDALAPAIVIASMVGNNLDYRELFEYLAKECTKLPVITISSKAESEAYENFYETNQFHRLLRPIMGKRVLEICRAVIGGRSYAEESDSAEGASGKSGEKSHILVVDDNAMVLRNMKRTLEDRYSVAVAVSGLQAFVSIGKKMPDLILLDYEMPEMNGKEVMEKLQTDEELKEIPIIFLTSVDSREIVMELLALKPVGYILKPADSEMLIDKIEGILGK